ncbi:MAG: redox-regulated ATPase YchF [Candidatus Omnitrophica bacterium]|nr:redox-regulated ATPase YchF [Candidatus Omnitrophota bacterium]MCM8790931.1 redox-regulated ATPase YchF [Candidatus Omnitrophota bacterium]
MKIGIIGLPQVGKKTLFELLTGHPISEKEIASGKPIKGVAEIFDPRFDKLVSLYKPAKEVRARIEIEALPRIEKDTIAKAEIFKDINDLDAICHVVRAFKDDSVYHVEGSVDPKRDIDFINAELILHDLIFIEKRLERLEKAIKQTKEEAAAKERELLGRMKAHLDKTLPLRLFELTSDEKKLITSYPFVTRKTLFLVLNVSEDALQDTSLLESLRTDLSPQQVEIMQVSAKVEREIAGLESEEDKREFLRAEGIGEPAINVLTRLCLKALDLISFFTVGPDEVRQWNIRKGSTAPEAAGTIHTDLQKGFIRAEVMKYADLEALGSEEKVRESGRFYIKGKDYVVEDGDIITIRFNV